MESQNPELQSYLARPLSLDAINNWLPEIKNSEIESLCRLFAVVHVLKAELVFMSHLITPSSSKEKYSTLPASIMSNALPAVVFA